MPEETRVVAPGKSPREVVTQDGDLLTVPKEWELLPPGDAGLTRRVKSLGPTWTVKEKRGRRVFSNGVWADAGQIETAKQQVSATRSTDAYAKKQKNAAARREKLQGEYVEDFQASVLSFLDFDSIHEEIARELAQKVAAHATPVGSGTVARTKRIPIEQRAESAVIAWMRHQTTAYDDMVIPRVKGKRREVRRMLAEQSRRVLNAYRVGDGIPENCPLRTALRQAGEV